MTPRTKYRKTYCLVCGREFNGWNSRSLYCSKACRNIQKAKRERRWQEKRLKKLCAEVKICEDCGRGFTGRPYAKYCRQCQYNRHSGTSYRTYSVPTGAPASPRSIDKAYNFGHIQNAPPGRVAKIISDILRGRAVLSNTGVVET